MSSNSLAILDDYHNIAPPYFSHIPNLTVKSFPETLHPKHASEDHAALIDRLQPFTIVSTMRERTPFPKSVLSALPHLKFLLTTGPRNLSIDEVAAHDLDIVYTGTTAPSPDPNLTKIKSQYSATNEHTWALLLALAKNVATDDYNVKTDSHGGWETRLVPGLAGKKLGLLGLGRLGAQAAITGKLGFGMDVICWSPNLTQEKADGVAGRVGLPAGTFTVVGSKRELCGESDVFSVHMVLSDRSKGVIGEEELNAMKKTCLLVNTSRGPLIDERALLKVLKEGRIKGAALDVFDVEPLPRDSEWRTMKWGEEGTSMVVLSPHMGYAEDQTMHEWYRQQAENVERWLKGEEVVGRILPEGVKIQGKESKV